MSGGYLLYSAPNIRNTYIPIADKDDQKEFEMLHKKISSYERDVSKVRGHVVNYIKNRYEIISLPRKLENWDRYSFKDFITTLNRTCLDKGEDKRSLTDESEWHQFIETKRMEINKLKDETLSLKNSVDLKFFELLSLTERDRTTINECFI